MENYTNFSFSNEISLNNDKSNCNPFNASNNMGNYFKQCNKESQSPLWGSFKPVKEIVCSLFDFAV